MNVQAMALMRISIDLSFAYVFQNHTVYTCKSVVFIQDRDVYVKPFQNIIEK